MDSSPLGFFQVTVHVSDHHGKVLEVGSDDVVGMPNSLVRVAAGGRRGVEVRYPIHGDFAGGYPFHQGEPDPFDYSVTVDLDQRGRLAVTRLEVRQRDNGPMVTTAHLRKIRVGALRQRLVNGASRPVLINDDGSTTAIGLGGHIDAKYYDATQRGALEGTTETRGANRQHLDAALLRLVAQEYRRAVAHGEHTAESVQRAVELDRGDHREIATIRRWISDARSRIDPETGRPFLGPAPTKGGKGEASGSNRGSNRP